jgi:hypothetical protein
MLHPWRRWALKNCFRVPFQNIYRKKPLNIVFFLSLPFLFLLPHDSLRSSASILVARTDPPSPASHSVASAAPSPHQPASATILPSTTGATPGSARVEAPRTSLPPRPGPRDCRGGGYPWASTALPPATSGPGHCPSRPRHPLICALYQ